VLRFFHLGVLALALAAGCAGDTPPQEPAPETFVTEHVLDNGLRVFLAEQPGSGLVASHVFVRAGAMRETADLNGAAHFLEHLLFNGTSEMTQEELYAAVDRLGAYNNASTRKDYAVFMFVVGAEDAREGFGIQADMLFDSTLPPDKLEKERGIVQEEIARDLSGASYRAETAIDSVLYEGTSYGRPILGTPASIEGLDQEAVRRYYETYYVPANTTAMILGDFETEEMLATVNATFGAVPRREAPPAPDPLPPMADPRWVQVPVEDDVRRIRIDLPAPTLGEDSHAAMSLVSSMLDGEGGRIRRALTVAPAVEVRSVSVGLTRTGGHGVFTIAADIGPKDAPEPVITRILGELSRLTVEPVTEGELASARVAWRVAEAGLREQIHYYGFMRGANIPYVSADALNRERGRVSVVTPDSVRIAAQEWFDLAPAQVVVVGPGLSPVDREPDIEALGLLRPEFALPGTGAAGPALPDPAPRSPERVPPTRHDLPGGGEAIVACDPASEILAIHVMLRGRSYHEPPDQVGITDVLHRLLPRGAGDLDRTALGARLAAIGATVKTHDAAFIPYDDYYTTPSYAFVRFETLDDFHEEAFSLLTDMLARPRLDPSQVAAVKEEMQTLLARGAASPAKVAGARFDELLHGPDSPATRGVMGTPETLAAIDAAALETFHREVYGPANLTVSVITGLPEDVVLDHLRTLFAALPGPRAEGTDIDRWTSSRTAPPVTGDPRTVEASVGAAQAQIMLGYAFDIAPADEAALRAAGMILSDRMAFHLRERLGLAYSIGASVTTWGDRALLQAAMGTRAENLSAALEGMEAQIDSMRVISLNDDEVAAAVASRVGRLRMRQITRMGQAFTTAMNVLEGEGPLAHETRRAALERVTADDLRRVAERYLDAGRAHRVLVE
jgi:predicted Zn-dependent peptidase